MQLVGENYFICKKPFFFDKLSRVDNVASWRKRQIEMDIIDPSLPLKLIYTYTYERYA